MVLGYMYVINSVCAMAQQKDQMGELNDILFNPTTKPGGARRNKVVHTLLPQITRIE